MEADAMRSGVDDALKAWGQGKGGGGGGRSNRDGPVVAVGVFSPLSPLSHLHGGPNIVASVHSVPVQGQGEVERHGWLGGGEQENDDARSVRRAFFFPQLFSSL